MIEYGSIEGFGLAHLKSEGCHAHPDDPNHGYWGDDEDVYFNQLMAYITDNSLDLIKEVRMCRRPHLLRRAIVEGPVIAFGIGE